MAFLSIFKHNSVLFSVNCTQWQFVITLKRANIPNKQDSKWASYRLKDGEALAFLHGAKRGASGRRGGEALTRAGKHEHHVGNKAAHIVMLAKPVLGLEL